MSGYGKSFLFIIFFTFTLFQVCAGHGHANQIILNPYLHPYTRVGSTLGGVSVALTDSVPDIFRNPAGFSRLNHFQAFASLNYGRNYIEQTVADYTEMEKQQNDDFYINALTLLLPLSIIDVPFTLAASYHGNHAYYYESGDAGVSDRFEAQLHLASLGLGLQPAPNLRLGLGWTHLIQTQYQTSVQISTDDCSTNETRYTSDIFYAGLQHDPNEALSLGLVFYFPAQLKPENETSLNMEMEQDYSASLQVGIGYQISDNWNVGLGYGYQWMEDYDAGLSTVSAGIGYRFIWDNHSLPLYLMYETILFPQSLNENISDHGENILKYHQIGAGGGIQFADFSVYAAANWSLYGDYFYTSSLVTPLPPYS